MASALPFLMLLLAAAQPVERTPVVRDGRFFVQDRESPDQRETSVVPLRTGQCYGWVIRVTPEERTVTIREVFELPGPGNWGSSSGDRTSAVSHNGRISVSEFQMPLGGGTIMDSWCVAEGDPAGPHRIRVYHGETLLHDFHFTLVPETH
jgi:hypothetical protein